jgi:Tetratricopeptide repeat
MPHVVNGCGTWYYGRKNLEQHQGVCRYCGSVATLTSYDTRLYAVVVMIPIVPLRAKRIIEDCSACRRHSVLPLKVWQVAKRRADETIAAYRKSRGDEELAKDVLRACVGYRDLPTFVAMAPELERDFASHAQMLAMLASAQDAFARLPEAERLLRAAMAVEDSAEVREALADVLIRLGRADEAEPYLAHVVEQGLPDRVDALLQLAQAYQLKGQHEKALEVFAQCEQINPLVSQNELFRKLREASAGRAGTNMPIRPRDVIRKAKAAEKFRRFLKVAPVVLLLAVMAYAALAWVMGMRSGVYLVNGLGRSYTVTVNGDTHILDPHGVKKIRVPEGDLKLEIVNAPPGVTAAETVAVHTPFWRRPFWGGAVAINPDHAAVIEWRRAFYAPSNWGAREPEITYSAGAAAYAFDDVDFAFHELPHSLTAEASSKQLSRTGLSVMTPQRAQMSQVTLLATLSKAIGPARAAEVARRSFLMESGDPAHLEAVEQLLKPAEKAALFRPLLAARPVQMPIHRA